MKFPSYGHEEKQGFTSQFFLDVVVNTFFEVSCSMLSVCLKNEKKVRWGGLCHEN